MYCLFVVMKAFSSTEIELEVQWFSSNNWVWFYMWASDIANKSEINFISLPFWFSMSIVALLDLGGLINMKYILDIIRPG